ncbi:rna-directed dna polymerase : Reverse transcriptase (RNA-dependent DNA polymerase) OS=Singulisphaera acidiphila (strain ATCC BAA-1392 / DSM 18658 / VKM B-2454 / MOB10) GN=Sinac_3415 PE=4 SV=1: RVT_1 [Gemmataceae bacterium]|nr:rna-directed dna polymerase : Reverse transcriptase (RNA-dependent DNA polymerase) OS=Singulisphaera acidiphila (strain ATCC BAA-1392 / DSM 18658 / VKM B-2454 / MOB10) GN=Sinac_3415 PE=4 SV=1: RVT_1 [Gemmataceae bacterium]VTU02632.1 rna-directed dna polymerase : Reverse transcriptase (RNA-dependent DNA polymerase) OS=Singulisphaera acidiphila (strain ATCC BAA-1392 / DSM 18658 / VKM B-2454 / MOB10) GN=Sinac_3415 PE=4 SV=1: RVT_1 [Gemmataceae bacterium]
MTTAPVAPAPSADPQVLWRLIVQAGGMKAYIDGQLKEKGFLVTRRDADSMSDREKDGYKKALKQEADERRKLRRETWGAYKANHIVHLGEGVFWSDDLAPDKWDTPNSEERAAENELPAIDRPEQLAELLGVTIPQLKGLAYHRDAATSLHYVRFTIPKRDGTERPIWAPKKRLKAAQRWILHNIVERLPVHGAAQGFLVGRSILSNAAVHANAKAILKMDIKEFFPTVTVRRVKGVFRRAGYRDGISTLLALICTEAPREVVEVEGETYYVSLGPRCLPQGAPTSPSLTNALCMRLDRRLEGLAKKLGWRYTRYADDLTFSLPAEHKGKPRLGTMIGCVTRIVAAEGFEVKAEKTRVHRTGGRQSVTGLVVNGDGPPRVSRTVRRQLRSAVHKLKTGKPLKEGESLARLSGYAAFVYMTNPDLGKKLLADINGATGAG